MRTQIETLEKEIAALENHLLYQENMSYLPKDFYKNQDKLHALKKELADLKSQQSQNKYFGAMTAAVLGGLL